jgi:hypothetical protein
MCRFRHKGVDEHAWRHTRKVDKYVIVIIDLTPIGDNTGPARLLDLIEGRSKKAFETCSSTSRRLLHPSADRGDGRLHRPCSVIAARS